MASTIKTNNITGFSGGAGSAPITLSGDTATLSGTGVTFPAGHIIQSIYNPTIASNSSDHTSEAVAASVTGQITITSGNSVLIYVQAGYVYLDRNSGDMGYTARIREGLTTSGTEISAVVERHTAHPSNWTTNFSLWGYDSSPADTTPDYCLTLTTSPSAGGAHYVRLESGYTSSTYLKFFLFEIQQ